jgi:hypothetical protein
MTYSGVPLRQLRNCSMIHAADMHAAQTEATQGWQNSQVSQPSAAQPSATSALGMRRPTASRSPCAKASRHTTKLHQQLQVIAYSIQWSPFHLRHKAAGSQPVTLHKSQPSHDKADTSAAIPYSGLHLRQLRNYGMTHAADIRAQHRQKQL